MFHRLDHRAGHYILLIAVWAVLFLPNLGGPSLWDIDEGNNAECFREMDASGNWIIPTFNYQLREDKPALLYWLQIGSARLFGINEWAARFPSAVAALLAVLSLYEMGRQMFGKRTALLAGVMLASSVSVVGAAHFANPDALLLGFTTLSLALFWHDHRTGGRGWLAGVGMASGLAVLAKGPVGLVLPAGVCLLFLAWQRQLRRLWDARLPGTVLAFLLVAAPWYIWVTAETKGVWLRGFLGKHNVERMLAPMESHGGSVFYYPLVLVVGLCPWSIFLGEVVWHTWSRLRIAKNDLQARSASAEDHRPSLALRAWRRLRYLGEYVYLCFRVDTRPDVPDREQSALRLLVLWFAIYFAFFSVVQTKLPNYILPAYPAVVLLAAYLLERWRRGEATIPGWMMRTSLVCLALVGAGVAAAMLVAGGMIDFRALHGRSFPSLTAWAWIGLVPMAGAAAGAWLLHRNRRGEMIAALAVATVLFTGSLACWGLQAVDSAKASKPLAQGLPADQLRREVRLAAYRFFQPSLVFYCRREVMRYEREDQALTFLRGPFPAFLFVPEDVWTDIQNRLGVQMHVLARHRDLYGGRTVLVVSNE